MNKNILKFIIPLFLILAACGGQGENGDVYEGAGESLWVPPPVELPTPPPTEPKDIPEPLGELMPNHIPQPAGDFALEVSPARFFAGWNTSVVITDGGAVYTWGAYHNMNWLWEYVEDYIEYYEENHNWVRNFGNLMELAERYLEPEIVERDRSYRLTPRRIFEGLDNAAAVFVHTTDVFALTEGGELWSYAQNGVILDDVAYIGNVITRVLRSDGTVYVTMPASLDEYASYSPYIFSAIWEFIGIWRYDWHMVRVGRARSIVSTPNHLNYVIAYNNQLWGWGNDQGGFLGIDPGIIHLSPVMIMPDIAQIVTGSNHRMVLTEGGRVYTWGAGSEGFGQLGHGNRLRQLQYPTFLMDGVSYIAAGANFSMALTEDGKLYAWGLNDAGQLGDGTYENRNTPVLIMENVVSLSTGNNHTLALTEGGVLLGWGDNSNGQLGDGTAQGRSTPRPVGNFEIQP